MKHFVYLLLAFAACSHTNNDISPPKIEDAGFTNKLDASKYPDANYPDANYADASVDDASYYAPCPTGSQEPTTYSRLLKNICIDTNNVSYIKSYFDTLLNIECNWKVASDFNYRCLPTNEQPPQYADPDCFSAIALIAVDPSGKPLGKYIGLYQFSDVSDAGADASSTHFKYINIFNVGRKWVDNGEMYYATIVDGGAGCELEYLSFGGTNFYYVGSKVDPTTFVLQ